jgi:hypothetical protein
LQQKYNEKRDSTKLVPYYISCHEANIVIINQIIKLDTIDVVASLMLAPRKIILDLMARAAAK